MLTWVKKKKKKTENIFTERYNCTTMLNERQKQKKILTPGNASSFNLRWFSADWMMKVNTGSWHSLH